MPVLEQATRKDFWNTGHTSNNRVQMCNNKRVREVTLTGDHMWFIGVSVIGDDIWGVAANAELIVVGSTDCANINRINRIKNDVYDSDDVMAQ